MFLRSWDVWSYRYWFPRPETLNILPTSCRPGSRALVETGRWLRSCCHILYRHQGYWVPGNDQTAVNSYPFFIHWNTTKQLNIFERKVYRRILGPVYDNEEENWRILTNEEIYANIKKPTITEIIRLHRLRWFGHVQRMEENRISKRVLYMNLETIRPRGRPRNRWLDEVREDGRMVGREEWQEKVYDREEWMRLLRTARNHRILFMPMDWLIDWL